MCFVKYTLAREPAVALPVTSAVPTTGAWASKSVSPTPDKATPAAVTPANLKKSRLDKSFI